MSSKGSLPLIARGNANKVVSTSEVNLGKDLQIVEVIEEVWDEWKWISILAGDGIETMPVDTKA